MLPASRDFIYLSEAPVLQSAFATPEDVGAQRYAVLTRPVSSPFQCTCCQRGL